MRSQLTRDFARFGRDLPRDFAAHVLAAYRIDLSTAYLGVPLPHPVGKGSGQLSLNVEQIEADDAAGLAFVALKTVIAEDATGTRRMGAWAVRESRMRVERRRSARGSEAWTVTWKGRGWDRSFDDYLALVRAARDVARQGPGHILAVPSAKYHLPPLDEPFASAEYRYTTRRLAEAWGDGPLLLELDFSPTLAADALADERATILRWLRECPAQIRGAGVPLRLAVKLMNARFDEAFQLDMMAAVAGADALIVFNRLWDSARGVAYGGDDLSDRNLRVLDGWRARHRPAPPLIATGNIASGAMLLAYARLGCAAAALHTAFQLPLGAYPATAGSRTQRVMHQLIFAPADGLVAGLLDLEDTGRIARRGGVLHFADAVGID